MRECKLEADRSTAMVKDAGGGSVYCKNVTVGRTYILMLLIKIVMMTCIRLLLLLLLLLV